MNKKFRCGRLMLYKDGVIKKLDLEDGGGSRSCSWDHKDLDFNDVYCRVLSIFKLDDSKYKTSLYDFQRRPLDVDQYETLSEYINKNGLNPNSTVIYLCTSEADDNDCSIITMTKKTKILPETTSTYKQKISILAEAGSSTTLDETKHMNNEESSVQQQIDLVSFEYSFEKSTDDLMNNIRIFLGQNSFDEILIKLFQYVCIMHGHVCSTADPLQQKMRESDDYFRFMGQSEIQLHSNSLNNIHKTCRSMKTLIKLNKNKFSHIQQFSTIASSFAKIYQNLKTVRNQWLEYVENNNRSNTASSSFTHPIESTPSRDHHETNVENSSKQSLVSSSSSCDPALPSDVFKPLSTFREPIEEDNNERVVLFQPSFKCLGYLLNILHGQNLTPVRRILKSIIVEIEALELDINIHNYQSLFDAKKTISSVIYRFTETFREHYFKRYKYKLNQNVTTPYHDAQRAMENLLKSLDQYEIQLDLDNPQERSNWSSPPSSFIDQKQHGNEKSMESIKRKLQHLCSIADDDQSSVASCSSVKMKLS